MIDKKDFAMLLKCAEIYKNELLNTNLLFIYINRKTKKYEYIETTYLDKNFKHLTGIQYKHENKNTDKISIDSAAHFFNLAVCKRLDIKKCHYKSDGTTKLKMQILPMAMNIKKNARMIGDYSEGRMHIMADKMCGTVSMTLAFINDRVYGYCPCSALREDIRKMVTQYHSISAVFQKNMDVEKYDRLCFKNKIFDFDSLPQEIKNKIDL